jgi:uncharacterized protein YggL (DUF469 family)
MDKMTLEQAIKIIEEAGGFVMMQGDLEQQDAPLTEARMDEIEAEEKQRIEEFQEKRRECHKELSYAFDKAIRNDMKLGEGQQLGAFGMYEMLENVCLDNGCDLDEIEDWIHSQF